MKIILAVALVGCGGGGFGSGGDSCEGELGDGTRLILGEGETFCDGGLRYTCDGGEVTSVADPECAGGGDSDIDTDADTDADTDGDTDTDTGRDVPPGCEREADPSECTGAPGRSDKIDVEVAGETRTYNLYVPANAVCGTPMGLLYFFHGLGGNEDNFNALEPYAEDHGLVYVQPRGSPQSWAGGNLGWVPDGFEDNVSFVQVIRSEVEREYEIDPYRVYVAGFSQGAFASAALASPDAIGDEIAGVGIFGGGEEGNTCLNSDCYEGLSCQIPFFFRTGDSDVHLEFTDALHQGLVDLGWPDAQLNYATFPGGHTIRPEDVEEMIVWLDGAYP